VAVLQWGTTQVPFQIEIINPNEVLAESLKAQLKGREKFLWGAYSDAASNLNARNIYPELALEWINKSLEIERNHVNLQMKASILLKKGGQEEEVKKLLYEAIPIMQNPLVFNSAIYNLLQIGDTKKAIEAAQTLTKQFSNHPRIWMFTDTLAETYLKDGNKEKAIEYYKLAQSKAPESQQQYFKDLLSDLEK
jgi:tetratricopeptide (TPR) repeat protein